MKLSTYIDHHRYQESVMDSNGSDMTTNNAGVTETQNTVSEDTENHSPSAAAMTVDDLSMFVNSSSEVATSNANQATFTNPASTSMLSVSTNPVNMSLSGVSMLKGSVKSPTCKVCSDESSGFHYGVDSCEGCKGFFRRCITQGMTHKCSNEEKCEITPFTRNSCQYCRLKKCFAVGMSREASRLGRRPKRLKDSGGPEIRQHTTNLPIAPYPTSPQELQKMKMAELQRMVQQNGNFKADLMQAFLQAAQVSFREHQRNHGSSNQAGAQNQVDSTNVKSPVDTNNHINSGEKSVISVKGQNGLESGYSSLSSPASSKSHSPLSTNENAQNVSDFMYQNQPHSVDSKGNLMVENLQSINFSTSSSIIPPSEPKNSIANEVSQIALKIKPEPGLENSHCAMHSSSPGDGERDSMSEGDSNLPNLPIEMMHVVSTMMPGIQPGMELTAEALTELTEKMFDPNVMDQFNFSPIDSRIESESNSPCSATMAKMIMFGGGSSPMQEDEEMEDSYISVDALKILDEVRLPPSDIRRTLIDQVTESVVEAHFTTCNPTYQNVSEANERLQEKVNKGELPDFSKLTLHPNMMWQQFTSAMVPEITLVVKFCKQIPGFSEIEQDDQINLIKQGSFEVMLCRFCNLIDIKKEEMFDPNMKVKCPRHVVKEMPMGSFLDEFFAVAEKFNPLKLTDGEIGLFTSALIICPEKKYISNKRAVTKLQSLLFQCLYILIKKNHYDYDNIFMKTINTIPEFRKINRKHQVALNGMKMSMPNNIKFPPLHQEVYDHGN